MKTTIRSMERLIEELRAAPDLEAALDQLREGTEELAEMRDPALLSRRTAAAALQREIAGAE